MLAYFLLPLTRWAWVRVLQNRTCFSFLWENAPALGFQTTEGHQQQVTSVWKCVFAGVRLARVPGSSKISQHSNVEFYILMVAPVCFFFFFFNLLFVLYAWVPKQAIMVFRRENGRPGFDFWFCYLKLMHVLSEIHHLLNVNNSTFPLNMTDCMQVKALNDA